MAKELIFRLNGKDFSAIPVKLERKKIYGWTETIAKDKDGEECVSAYLSPDDVLIIPSGGLKQATVNTDGRWIEKNELIAFDEAGENILTIIPSAFDSPIELTIKTSKEEFLDNDWESVYQILNDELANILGEDIYKFDFSYRGGTNHNYGYLISSPQGLFLFAGDQQTFSFVGLNDDGVIDETEDFNEEDNDELDFSMF